MGIITQAVNCHGTFSVTNVRNQGPKTTLTSLIEFPCLKMIEKPSHQCFVLISVLKFWLLVFWDRNSKKKLDGFSSVERLKTELQILQIGN